MKSIRFDWSTDAEWIEFNSNNNKIEHLSADKFNRAIYAEFLTKYLSVEGKSNSYVLNLNAEWGAGKTWFIKRWHNELQKKFPTVYIDAWQQDFSDDPLLTVFSSISEQLRALSGSQTKIPTALSDKLFKLLKGVGKIAVKSAMNSAGIKIDDIDLTLDGSDVDDIVATLCTTHRERHEAIQDIKKDIREWIEACVGKKKLEFPAFILIDELDRCRPSYAVEMLETIKHIFDIPGIVFVIATDTEQLQHAIKVIYGAEFDARSYLGRFFKRRFSLYETSRHEFISSCVTNKKGSLSLHNCWPFPINNGASDIQSLIDALSVTSDTFNLSLRQTEQLIDRVIATIVHNDYESVKVNIFILSFLCAIYEKHYDIYNNFVNGNRDFNISAWFEKLSNHIIEIHLIPGTILGASINEYPRGHENNSNGMIVSVNNRFKNGTYRISYSKLIAGQMNVIMTNQSLEREHDKIYSKVSNSYYNTPHDDDMTLILLRYEQIHCNGDIYFYKNLVELATNLD